MALRTIMKSSKEERVLENQEVRRSGPYEYVDTPNEGIKRIVSKQGGYLVFLDYGRILKLNKKTGKRELKQHKTCRRVETEVEARRLRREAEDIREGNDVTTHRPKKVLLSGVVEDFKKTTRYLGLTESSQEHYDNHFNHILDYFSDFEVSKITALDIENYYDYQRTRGNLESSRKKDGTVNKKKISKTNTEGISINTLGKHRTTLKNLWEFMIDSKSYGVRENVVLAARMPKETLDVDGKIVKVSRNIYKLW